MVTDYDCWHPDHDAVQVADIVRVLLENAEHARSLVTKIAPRVHGVERPCPAGCQRVLDDAIITGPEARDPQVVRTLDAVAGRVL
jgi:5'-methylthioadenosine phosphorylase